jgi:4a-hydroxytetrahydrobiopterin dehydratase
MVAKPNETELPKPAVARKPAVSAELKRRIAAELPGWRVVRGELVASWKLPDFANALGAAVRVGALAEHAGHHPDLSLGWGYVAVRLSSHDAGGVTEADLALAVLIQNALGQPE